MDRFRPIDAKIESIYAFPVPINRRELRRFLGMAGYYRGFCPNFASIVASLTDLISTEVPFEWSTVSQQAFDGAKALLASTPVLVAPDFSQPFCLAVDASDTGAGVVLLQKSLFFFQKNSMSISEFTLLWKRRRLPLFWLFNILKFIWDLRPVQLWSIPTIILWCIYTE